MNFLEIEDIVEGGDEQRFQQFVPEEEVEEPDYGNQIPWLRDVNTGEIIKTETSGETRVGIFGPTGSSKTTGIKRFVGSTYKNNHKIAHISDVTNSFQKVNRYGGVNKKYREVLGLLPGEKPFEMDRAFVIPNFMVRQHYDTDPRSYAERFSFGFQDISKNDFRNLLGDLKSSYEDILDVILPKVDFDTPSEELDYNRWDRIISLAEEESSGRSKIVRTLKALRERGVVDDSMRIDVTQRLNERDAIALGLKNYEQADLEKIRFYSSQFMQKLSKDIRNGDLDVGNGLVIATDEFHVLDDSKSSNQFNQAFDQLLKISGRRADATVIIASQRPALVSNSDSGNSFDFISDLTDAVLLRGKQRISEADWKIVLKSMGIYRGKSHLNYCRELFAGLDRYQGVYASSIKHDDPRDLQVVNFLSPQIHHKWKES